MDPAQIPRFRGYRTPGGADFDGARSQIQTGFGQLDVNLTTASSAIAGNSNGVVIFPIAGDFLYIDTDPVASNGFASLQFNVQQDAGGAKFYAQPGEAWLTTFKQIALSWAAQPGKSIRLLYATGDRVAPAFTASTFATIINAINNPANVTDQGIVYGASYKSNSALTLNTPDPVWAAASNVNGAVVWQAEGMSSNNVGLGFLVLLSKATAPASVIDGVIIAQVTFFTTVGTNFPGTAKLGRATNIPAGLRGDWIVGSTDTGSVIRSALYTLK